MTRKIFLFFALLAGSLLATAQQKTLILQDLNNPKLQAKYLQNIQWKGDGQQFSYLANNAMLLYQVRDASRDTLLRLVDLNDRLVESGFEKLKRFPSVKWMNPDQFTFVANRSLLKFDTRLKKLEKINSWNEDATNTDIDYKKFQVAYTRDNNLYVVIGGRETAVTSDENKGIVNGSERVHRNEWGIEKGTFWSPGGNYLAFYRMDETMVADYPLVNLDTRIATVENTKYPMAGEKSHEVTLGVYSMAAQKTIFLNTGEPKEQFLTNISWSPDEKYIFIAVLNRAQDHMWLRQYDAQTGDYVKTIFEESNPRYVEPLNSLFFLTKTPTSFIYQSQRDGYNHLYLYDNSGKLIKQLTRGQWVVDELIGTDPGEENVFFTSSLDGPLEKHFYSVNIKSGKITKLSSAKGTHTVFLSPDAKNFIDQYSSRDIAVEYTLSSTKGKALQTIQKNENPLKDYQLGETSIFPLRAKDGTDLYCRMIKPLNFDPAKKYPVILYVYGGPHSQLVTESWLGGAGLYMNLLASEGYLVFTMDNHGTSRRGFDFESIIHRHCGKQEMEDQMMGVEYLKSLSYVDASRIALDGWSYGGFMVISLMLKQPGVFKVATAGGPVIDWKYYEVMYGERYMDTPQENPEGYAESSLLNSVTQLKGKLMILQGYQDNTVVPQNCLSFIKKAIENGIQLDFFLYPNHEHNVRGKDRLHLYNKLIDYYKQNL